MAARHGATSQRVVDGKVMVVSGTAQDITARKQAETGLAETLSQLDRDPRLDRGRNSGREHGRSRSRTSTRSSRSLFGLRRMTAAVTRRGPRRPFCRSCKNPDVVHAQHRRRRRAPGEPHGRHRRTPRRAHLRVLLHSSRVTGKSSDECGACATSPSAPGWRTRSPIRRSTTRSPTWPTRRSSRTVSATPSSGRNGMRARRGVVRRSRRVQDDQRRPRPHRRR